MDFNVAFGNDDFKPNFDMDTFKPNMKGVYEYPKFIPPTLQEKTATPVETEQIIEADEGYDGLSKVMVEGIVTEEKTATENGTVTPTEGKYLKAVIVAVPDKIPNLQNKTVSATEDEQFIKADSGFDGLDTVTIEPIQTETRTVTENGTVTPTAGKYLKEIVVNVPDKIPNLQDKTVTPNATAQEVTADSGYDGLGVVTVNGDDNLTAENIKKDVEIFGVLGAYEGGSEESTDDLAKDIIERVKTELIINAPVTQIGEYAFYGYKALKNISLPDGITSIGKYAFMNCTNLALTSLPENLTSIGDYAFYGCTNLALTSLPDGITSIGTYTFRECTHLALTALPENLTSIGTYAFYSCTNLALTSLPDGITSIGAYTFYRCPNLVLTSFPNGLTSIAACAFSYCTKLSKLWIPSTCTTINASTYSSAPFYQCFLHNIYTDATEKPSGWGAYFNYTSSSSQATVHYGVSKEEYEEMIANGTI